MDTPRETENFFEEIRVKDHNKLTSVGFTDDQARVLSEMMQTKAFSGGIL